MGNKCTGIGLWVCLLIALMAICVLTKMNNPTLLDAYKSNATTHVSAAGDTGKNGNDTDGDGLTNEAEKRAGLNPMLADTDADGKPDGIEGLQKDSDNDGIIDALESAIDDSDLDGVPDELDSENTNPDNDSDGDGYVNGLEKVEGTNPMNAKSFPADKDKDGIPDNIDADAGAIDFIVIKKGKTVSINGTLNGIVQIEVLRDAFGRSGTEYKNGVIVQNSNLQDKNGAIALAKIVAPMFLEIYTDGTVSFKNNTFEVSGTVNTLDQKEKMEKLLSENAGLIHYVNDTRVEMDQKSGINTNENGAN